MLAEIVPYLISAALVILAHRNGVQIPGLPTPAPTVPKPPVQDPAADKPATDYLSWVLDVKTGKIKLDDRDRETLKLIRSAMEGVE